MARTVHRLIALVAWTGLSCPVMSAPPSLKVEAHDATGDSRDGAFVPPAPRAELQWSAQNCQYVMILGTHTDVVPCSGKLSFGGTFIVIAVGPDGATLQGTGAEVTMRPPGRGRPNGINGASYSLKTDFNMEALDKSSYRGIVRTAKSVEAVRRAVVDVLQATGFSTAEGQIQGSFDVVYTPAFAVQVENLDLSAAASAKHRPVMWQVAYVVAVQAPIAAAPQEFLLRLLPAVQVNFPRDNRDWKIDPDGSLLTLPLSRNLVSQIQERLR